MKSITPFSGSLASATASSGGSSPSDDAPTTPTRRRLSSHPPPRPWGTTILDNLRFFLPGTWYGLIQNAKKSPFVDDINWNPLLEGIMGLVLPWLISSIVCYMVSSILGGQQQLLSSPPYTAILSSPPVPLYLYLLSPWSLHHCLLLGGGVKSSQQQQPIQQLIQMAIDLRFKLRAKELSDAVDIMWEFVDDQRLIRKRRYDLFLPPPPPSLIINNNNNNNNTSTISVSSTSVVVPTLDDDNKNNIHNHHKIILFLPGAAVPTSAYATVASKFANAGYSVVVPSMEPMRMAMDHLGADWSSIERIMKNVERYLTTTRSTSTSTSGQSSKSKSTSTTSSSSSFQWILAGHSLGSFAAMKLFVAFHHHHNNNNKNANFNISTKLIMWGMMYAPTYAASLQKPPNNDNNEVQLLLIQGNHDSILDMTTASQKEEFEKRFLPTTKINDGGGRGGGYKQVIIDGGTHHGFASYQPQSSFNNNCKDGIKRSLSRQEQQEMACQETIQFLQQQQQKRRRRWW